MLTFRAIVLALLLALPTPVLANGGKPRPEPPGIMRLMTFDDATSPSQCIGNPVTPLCAVETREACFLRHDPSPYAVIGEDAAYLAGKPLEQRRDAYTHYKIIDIEKLTEANIPAATRRLLVEQPDRDELWRPGDVRVHLDRQLCSLERGCGFWSCARRVFLTRRDGARWGVVTIGGPRC